MGQSERGENAVHLASNLTCRVTVQGQETERVAHQDPLPITNDAQRIRWRVHPGGPALVRTRFRARRLGRAVGWDWRLPLVRSGPPYELMADGPYADVEV